MYVCIHAFIYVRMYVCMYVCMHRSGKSSSYFSCSPCPAAASELLHRLPSQPSETTAPSCHTYIHTYTYIHTQYDILIIIRSGNAIIIGTVCKLGHVYICTYILYIHTYMNTVHTYCTYINTYIRTYIQTYCTYIHTYIHTYKPTALLHFSSG